MSATHTPIHTLLVVGAGAGDDLATWRALKPKRLVLFEPNPDLHRVLAKKIRAQAGEELIAKVCVAKDANAAELQVLSMAPESGLYAPAKALREFWPNIAVTKTVQVEAEPITRLVSGLGLNLEENNALILDAPGAEAELLRALMASPESKVFSTISVRTAAKPLYESDASQETVEAVLRAAFYDVKEAQESDVSPHVSLSFTLDSRAVSIAERDGKIAALEQQMQELAQAKEKEKLNLAAQVTQLAGQLEGVQAELNQSKLANQELESARALLEQQKRELRESKDREIAQLTDARDTLSKEKVDLIATRDTLAKEKADLTAARDTLTKEKSDLTAVREILAKEKSDLAAHVAKVSSELEGVQTELNQSKLANQELESTKVQLAQAKDREIAGLRNEITEFVTARDTLSKEKSDLTVTRDRLVKERADLMSSRDTLVKEKADLITACDALAKEKVELSGLRDALLKEKVALTEQLGALQAQLQDHRGKVQLLETTNYELTARQALMNEELIKAEAQLELIKDLLLKDEVRL